MARRTKLFKRPDFFKSTTKLIQRGDDATTPYDQEVYSFRVQQLTDERVYFWRYSRKGGSSREGIANHDAVLTFEEIDRLAEYVAQRRAGIVREAGLDPEERRELIDAGLCVRTEVGHYLRCPGDEL